MTGATPADHVNGRRVVVVAAPHVALTDAMVLVSLGIPISPVAAGWVAQVPLIGSLAKAWQTIIVHRRDGGEKVPGGEKAPPRSYSTT